MIYGTLSFPTYALINLVQECEPNVRFEHKIVDISCEKSKDAWPGATLDVSGWSEREHVKRSQSN
jgi:hypothetical protein